MKKFIGFLLCIGMILSMLFGIAPVSAAPAPHLTNLQIKAVMSSGTSWEQISDSQSSANNPMVGNIGYLTIVATGTGINMQIYNNGNNITSVTSEASPTEYITDSGNVVIGYIYYKQFPLSSVSSGSFTVQMWDYSNGTSLEDSLNINVINSPPVTPANISVNVLSSSSVAVNWPSSSTASNYQVATTANGQTQIYDVGNSTWFTHSGLIPNTSYTYKVRAVNAVGSSGYSTTKSVYTFANSPNNGTIIDVSSDNVQASWSANGNPTDTEYALAAFDSSDVLISMNDWTTSVSDTIYGLVYSSDYKIKVKARNADENETDWYVIGDITTTVPGAPAIPNNLSVSAVSPSEVSVVWSSANAADGYILEFSEGGGQPQPIDVGRALSFSHTGLKPNTNYTYRIQSYNSFASSNFTSPVTKNTYAAIPTTGVIDNVTSTSIKASWNANGNPSGTYFSLAAFNQNNSLVKQNPWTTTTQDTITGLEASTTYIIKAKAKNTESVETSWLDIGSITTLPTTISGIIAMDGGQYHSIALKSDGTVWAWGLNNCGQLGDGTTVNKKTPVQVSGLTDVKAIASGVYFNLALKNDGTVWAWGDNGGQLGDGTTTERTVPVQVIGLTDVKAISAKRLHSLALKNDGTVWAWGDNSAGQLGDGTTTDKTVPVQVIGLTDVKAIAAGSYHNIILKNDGTVWAWGRNSNGQLGDGTTTTRITPIQIASLTNVKSIAVGSEHNLVLKDDGTVWAWGGNYDGEVGNSSKTDQKSPVKLSTLSDVKAISAGLYFSFALKNDGTFWTWGDNDYGQLGLGSTGDKNAPTKATSFTGLKFLAGGAFHGLGIKNNDTAWAWGYNNNGQLGDGTATNHTTPIAVTGLQ